MTRPTYLSNDPHEARLRRAEVRTSAKNSPTATAEMDTRAEGAHVRSSSRKVRSTLREA
jgi:hypothetical protein